MTTESITKVENNQSKILLLIYSDQITICCHKERNSALRMSQIKLKTEDKNNLTLEFSHSQTFQMLFNYSAYLFSLCMVIYIAGTFGTFIHALNMLNLLTETNNTGIFINIF